MCVNALKVLHINTWYGKLLLTCMSGYVAEYKKENMGSLCQRPRVEAKFD